MLNITALGAVFKKMKFSQIPQKIVQFFKEVKIELKKVTWPTRQNVWRYTMVVIVFSLAVAAFLGGLDMFFGYLIKKFLL